MDDSSKIEALDRLISVARAQFESDTAELSELLDADRQLVTKIARLRQTDGQSSGAFEFQCAIGSQMRLKWAQERLRALNSDRAIIRSRIENCRPKAVRSFGKFRALSRLLDRTKKDAMQSEEA